MTLKSRVGSPETTIRSACLPAWIEPVSAAIPRASAATLVAAALLHVRQQRFDAMHEMATLHRQMNDHRQALWRWQARIAKATEPPALIQAIARAELALEPVTPQQRGVTLARAFDD